VTVGVDAHPDAGAGQGHDHRCRRHQAIVPRAPPAMPGDDLAEHVRGGCRPVFVEHLREIEVVVHLFLQSRLDA
jgi:hypothetical protein